MEDEGWRWSILILHPLNIPSSSLTLSSSFLIKKGLVNNHGRLNGFFFELTANQRGLPRLVYRKYFFLRIVFTSNCTEDGGKVNSKIPTWFGCAIVPLCWNLFHRCLNILLKSIFKCCICWLLNSFGKIFCCIISICF